VKGHEATVGAYVSRYAGWQTARRRRPEAAAREGAREAAREHGAIIKISCTSTRTKKLQARK